MKLAPFFIAVLLTAMGATRSVAVPLTADDVDALAPAAAASSAWKPAQSQAGDNTELETWVNREADALALRGHVDRERGELLQQPYHPRAPTWIQSAATVNIGDFPTLDREDERGERELETTLWLLEDSARRAARAAAGSAPQETEDSWLRSLLRGLLPVHAINVIKANRDLVAVGGIAILTLVGLYAALSVAPKRSSATRRRRRSSASDSSGDTAQAKPRTRVRRRRRRHRHHRSLAPSESGQHRP